MKRNWVIAATTAAALVVGGAGAAIAVPLITNAESVRTVSQVQATPSASVVPVVTPTPTPTPTVTPEPASQVVQEQVAEPDPGPDLCPDGTQANSSDGYNDTTCLPSECYQGRISNETHPQCALARPPSYYR